MIYKEDLLDDLHLGDLRRVENAFRALVAFPHEKRLDFGDSIADLMALLDAVCDGLRDDRSTMPRLTRDLIENTTGDWIKINGTYAAGAAAVKEYREIYRRGYLAHLSFLRQ